MLAAPVVPNVGDDELVDGMVEREELLDESVRSGVEYVPELVPVFMPELVVEGLVEVELDEGDEEDELLDWAASASGSAVANARQVR